MAGHSHWAQIKRAKGAADLKRGQLFSKLSREITVAARLGGGDPDFNPRLRQAITNAKAESMPADNIERAIKKGTGELESQTYEELLYEAYAPGGVALMIEILSDNKNRTAQEMRALFSRAGGSLAATGAVAWMFKRRGWFHLEQATEDAVLEATLDAGADDVLTTPEGGVEVFCPVDRYDAVEKALKAAGFTVRSTKLGYFPDNTVPVTDAETAQKVIALIEKLEEHDDVQAVYSNASIDPALLPPGGS
jgi:YebC/PmpR family DNA-binding regulatory protein